MSFTAKQHLPQTAKVFHRHQSAFRYILRTGGDCNKEKNIFELNTNHLTIKVY
jgi:hypothetical protein